MKRIVVTGAKGGTGPTVVRSLRAAGHDVVGADLKPATPIERDCRQVNLEDGAQVHDVFAGADAIVHFGSLPTDTWTSWESAYRNIALGGFHVLQGGANLGISRLVLASSPTIYGSYAQARYFPIDEQAPEAPTLIYGAAKQGLELLARQYVRWRGMSIAALRPFRIVYEGSYEWRFRRYTAADDPAADALWAYVDARDVATACLAWIASDLTGFEAFNLAADDVCVQTPTRDLLKRFYPQITDVRGSLAGRSSLVSCEKIKRMLGWAPQHKCESMAAESEARGASSS